MNLSIAVEQCTGSDHQRELRPRQAAIRDAVTMKQFRRGELVFDVVDSGTQ